LIDSWLHGVESIFVEDEASVSLAREAVRAAGARAGLAAEATAAIATAASELAHNQRRHARGGQIAVRTFERDGAGGVEVIAADAGEGIASPRAALEGVSSAAGGLGIGLAGVRGLCDEIDVDVRLGEGTCVWARKLAQPGRRRREIGVFGRPHPHERVSGDHAAFVRDADAITVAVADGLGHGPLAREASNAAVWQFLRSSGKELDDVFVACHEALKGTRGAVMTLARVREPAGVLRTASVGNVSAYVCGPAGTQRFGGASFVLGAPGALRVPRIEDAAPSSRDALVVHTDGITSRASLDGRLDLLREHPIVIAHTIVAELARADDDVLVLVAR